MDPSQPNNPLHGVTLSAMLESLVESRGWDDLADRIRIRCFAHEPSLKSSLKFLRRTDWARREVEALYLRDLSKQQARRERNRQRAAQRAYRAEQEALAATEGPALEGPAPEGPAPEGPAPAAGTGSEADVTGSEADGGGGCPPASEGE